MPLVYRVVTPTKLSSTKLELKGKYDSEFIAVNNKTLVHVLRQLASLVNHAADIFAETAALADQVGRRVRSVKLRLDELEAKAELFDPKLVPVPEGSLDDVSISTRFSREVVFESSFFTQSSRPRFLSHMFENAGSHQPKFPPRSPVATLTRKSVERLKSIENRRPASFAALRDWKLDDFLDEKIATLDKKKRPAEEVNKALASPFPCQLVQVDVTGRGFDRMKRNRRSLVIHTKKIRNKKRRNTICGSMPNKECGIQTSFSSVNSPTEDTKKYGIDSGHWSSCTSSAQEGNGCASTTSAPSPWDPTSLSTSSDFLFDEEDRCLTPQLENFTDGLVSDSDSVDTDGYFTSFRSDCGFPKSNKKSPANGKESGSGNDSTPSSSLTNGNPENEYELFGKGSTSTTASSSGTVVLRNKPNPPARTTSAEHLIDKKSQSDDAEWEERVKRKSLIERVPSLVVVTPSPSCSSASPPPLKDPELALDAEDSDKDSGRITPKAGDFQGISSSDCGTISDTDSEMRSELCVSVNGRPASTGSSTGTVSSGNSTLTLTGFGSTTPSLPQPDVIPDVQQLQIIRTKSGPKLDVNREYFALDTVLLGSSLEEERHATKKGDDEIKMNNILTVPINGKIQSPQGSATSGKIRGARVILDANGEIIFASETLRRKRKPKVSFDPGSAVKTLDYDSCANYMRIRESVYDRIRKDPTSTSDKLYECIEEIRKQNMRDTYLDQDIKEQKILNDSRAENSMASPPAESRCSSSSSNGTISSQASSLASRYATRPPMSPPQDGGAKVNILLETDLDSAIPPSMPDLKNLPKIKDRLKRNESYRIANTDDVPPQNRPALVSLLPNNKSPNRRMPFGNRDSTSPNGNLHLNKKRDIREEDPAFIQQILNMSITSAKSPSNSFANRITLSKLALSPEDRPSFLRRESPPTMDEIAKEIYRFRKKFNIQPNATSKNLLPRGEKVIGRMEMGQNQMMPIPETSLGSSSQKLQRGSGPYESVYLDRNANETPKGSRCGRTEHKTSPNSTIPIGFPKLTVQFSSPLSSSTPMKPSANTSKYASSVANASSMYSSSRPSSGLSSGISSSYCMDRNYSLSSQGSITGGVSNTLKQSTPPQPPIRNFSSSGRRIFPTKTGALNPSDYDMNQNMSNYPTTSSKSSFNWSSLSYRRNSLSMVETSPGSVKICSRTSLTDFKKLLQAAQRKKSPLSAMEALKPKIGLETTL